MSAPLSGQFDTEINQTTGMYAGPRGRISPRGVTYAGVPGMFWDQMPALIAGQSDYVGLSTVTGAPAGTPDVGYTDKVGGGAGAAQIPDFGGTAAY
jgi:hypothetical protein